MSNMWHPTPLDSNDVVTYVSVKEFQDYNAFLECVLSLVRSVTHEWGHDFVFTDVKPEWGILAYDVLDETVRCRYVR